MTPICPKKVFYGMEVPIAATLCKRYICSDLASHASSPHLLLLVLEGGAETMTAQSLFFLSHWNKELFLFYNLNIYFFEGEESGTAAYWVGLEMFLMSC